MVYPFSCPPPTPQDYDEGDFDDEDIFNEFEIEERDTEPCPYCDIEIYEDSEICPHCGSYIIMEASRPSHLTWVFWTALILLILILSGFTCLL